MTGTDCPLLCSVFNFAAAPSLSVPESTAVQLLCGDRRLKTHSAAGRLTLGAGATLTLLNCNWDSFVDDAASLNEASIAGHEFPGAEMAPEAVIHLKDSLLRLPCSVRRPPIRGFCFAARTWTIGLDCIQQMLLILGGHLLSGPRKPWLSVDTWRRCSLQFN